jgi:ribosomal protein S18 acetylase RimI-like enzyme
VSRQLDAAARRFQAWQLDALNQHPPSTELVSFGPFRALVPPANQPGGWVTIVEGSITERETVEAVSGLRSVFKLRNSELEIEYNEALFPMVGRWLEAEGLTIAERNPLMACRPDGFKPFAARGVILRRLTMRSGVADMQAFQLIRWTNGGDNAQAVPPVERLRNELASESSVYLLAWLDGEPAGTGVSHSLKAVAEIVGVVTQANKRRRGVAATVTSNLVARHFAAGGDFVFLDAADEAVAMLYERLGFKKFGTNVIYR